MPKTKREREELEPQTLPAAKRVKEELEDDVDMLSTLIDASEEEENFKELVDLYADRGKIYLELGSIEESIADYKNSLGVLQERFPENKAKILENLEAIIPFHTPGQQDYIKIHNFRAEVLLSFGRVAESRDSFLRVINAFLFQRDNESAFKYFLNVTQQKIPPGNAQQYYDYAIIAAYKLQNYILAEQYVTSALQMQPDHLAAQELLEFLNKKKNEELIREVRKEIAKQIKHRNYHVAIAITNDMLAEIKIDPSTASDRAVFYRLRAFSRKRLSGSSSEVIDDYKQAIVVQEQSPNYERESRQVLEDLNAVIKLITPADKDYIVFLQKRVLLLHKHGIVGSAINDITIIIKHYQTEQKHRQAVNYFNQVIGQYPLPTAMNMPPLPIIDTSDTLLIHHYAVFINYYTVSMFEKSFAFQISATLVSNKETANELLLNLRKQIFWLKENSNGTESSPISIDVIMAITCLEDPSLSLQLVKLLNELPVNILAATLQNLALHKCYGYTFFMYLCRSKEPKLYEAVLDWLTKGYLWEADALSHLLFVYADTAKNWTLPVYLMYYCPRELLGRAFTWLFKTADTLNPKNSQLKLQLLLKSFSEIGNLAILGIGGGQYPARFYEETANLNQEKCNDSIIGKIYEGLNKDIHSNFIIDKIFEVLFDPANLEALLGFSSSILFSFVLGTTDASHRSFSTCVAAYGNQQQVKQLLQLWDHPRIKDSFRSHAKQAVPLLMQSTNGGDSAYSLLNLIIKRLGPEIRPNIEDWFKEVFPARTVRFSWQTNPAPLQESQRFHPNNAS
jgi:tetratricopeptide (TPR) repeat protein